MDILDKLKSQIGDDVQHIFDHEALFKAARDEITALRARLEAVEKERDNETIKRASWEIEAKTAQAALATARRDALDEARRMAIKLAYDGDHTVATAIRALLTQEESKL